MCGDGNAPAAAEQQDIDRAIASVADTLLWLREVCASRFSAERDEWVSQKDSPLLTRVHTRLCRRMLTAGDPRAAVRSRIHYIRQSAIDDHLRGSPQPKEPPKHPGKPSAGAALLAELGM